MGGKRIARRRHTPTGSDQSHEDGANRGVDATSLPIFHDTPLPIDGFSLKTRFLKYCFGILSPPFFRARNRSKYPENTTATLRNSDQSICVIRRFVKKTCFCQQGQDPEQDTELEATKKKCRGSPKTTIQRKNPQVWNP